MSQKYEFNADIGKVLSIVINSIYTNKDIFLRELISNASDAIEKLRYESIKNADLLPQNYEPKIEISFVQDAKQLVIRDNGIGMNKDDLINNLGTIAKSGTQAFIERLKQANEASSLIGQFGVGFYSAFMVADEVCVKTLKAGENNVYFWKSNGVSGFEIEDLQDQNFVSGTEITLHFKSEESEHYLDKFELERIIKTYSNHISTPIELEDEAGNKKIINSQKALWLRSPKDISAEEYKEFYRNLTHLPDDPLITVHNKVEGVVEYTNLLFVPSMKPFDLYSPDRKTAVKLYVNRVFITENNKEILPEYLRFVKGVIDSADLPLNISRETFQNNRTIEKIRNSVVKKIFGELKNKLEKDREMYEDFWNKFGNVLKEGLCDYTSDKEMIMEVCLFKTTKSGDKYVTIQDYLDNMKSDQDAIYFITGDETEDLAGNPQLEAFKKQDIEVLLLNNTVDDFWVNVVIDYKGKDLKNVAVGDIKAGVDETKDQISEDSQQNIKDCFLSVLGDSIKDVKFTDKLVDSPVCLSADQGAMTIRMEKYLYEQKQIPRLSPKILEINPNSKIIQMLNSKYTQNNKHATDEVRDIVNILFDAASISAGTIIARPNEFFNRMNKVLEKLAA